MRSFRHWSTRYIFDRIREIIYHTTHPAYPWLTKEANSILLSHLKKSDTGLEFGSGRSTLWFARRIAILTSVEHDQRWYKRTSKVIKEKNIFNVNYLLFEENRDEEDGEGTKYVGVAERFSKDSLDFVLIDGLYRSACANAVLDKIHTGSLLIIDNVNWYLPSASISPSSRTFAQGPTSELWQKFLEAVRDWQCIWTSSGVTDTAIYIKP